MGVVETCGERQVWIEECEECTDCTSRGLHDIRKALEELSIAVADKADIEKLIQSLTDSVIQLSEQLTFIDQNKQERLVSGENIKTINNISLLGSGNITVGGGGGGGVIDVTLNGLSVVNSSGVAVLADIATRTWVQNQEYVTESWVLDKHYVTEDTEELENYYLKEETYTKEEVDDLISGISPEELIPITNEQIDALPE